MSIEAIQHRVLTALNPDHGSMPPARWQQRKSAQTRARLIEAGIDCLTEEGYAGLSTAAVAERCAVSRGAMHHHFATRLDLVSAVVEVVFYRRMRDFLADYFTALTHNGAGDLLEIACEAHWRSVHTREYAAYLQLAVAARADAELAAHFVPTARRYDAVWTSEMIEAFPQWAAHRDAMRLASDFAQAAQLGMLVHEQIIGTGDRMQAMRKALTATIRDFYDA